MRGDLIETECRACGQLVHIVERADCPACGAGPAIPSTERVTDMGGRLVRVDIEGLYPTWISTRPARQTIAVDARRRTPEAPSVPRKRRRGRVVDVEQIDSAVSEWIELHAETPSRADIAAVLGCHPTTLKRAQTDAAWKGWPPRPPRDRSEG